MAASVVKNLFRVRNNGEILPARHEEGISGSAFSIKLTPADEKIGNNDDLEDELARFMESSTDTTSLNRVRHAIRQKVLSQFPIFALNDDYLRAISLVIMDELVEA